MVSSKKECTCCCEVMNTTTKKEIICNFCSYSICYKCFCKYIIESANEGHCCNCRHVLTKKYIKSVTTDTFYKKYINRQIELYIEREKSFLPQTQQIAVRYKRMNELKNEINKLTKEKREIKKKFDDVDYKIKILQKEVNDFSYKEKPKSTGTLFVKCPVDNCNGFVFREADNIVKCSLCHTHLCINCHEIKTGNIDKNHKCNPDDVKTIKAMEKDTKTCPSCATKIYKISGCDQMFCTTCHIAFSWDTKKIEKGVIHNPHYYEWQRSMNNGVAPRVPGDVVNERGRLPSIRDIYDMMCMEKQEFKKYAECHRSIGHINHVAPLTYQTNDIDNSDLRVKYLVNEIDDAKWRRMLKIRQKKIETNREIIEVLNTYTTTMTDIFNVFYSNTSAKFCLEEQAIALKKYINEELRDIYKNTKIKSVPSISDDWDLILAGRHSDNTVV